MGCLEELNKYVKLIEDICAENDLECFIDIYHENRQMRYTSVDFDIAI